MRPAVKADGSKYYEYVLCYVDDILMASMNPQQIMKSIERNFPLKPGSVKDPDIYLGADVQKWYIEGSEEPGKGDVVHELHQESDLRGREGTEGSGLEAPNKSDDAAIYWL